MQPRTRLDYRRHGRRAIAADVHGPAHVGLLFQWFDTRGYCSARTVMLFTITFCESLRCVTPEISTMR